MRARATSPALSPLPLPETGKTIMPRKTTKKPKATETPKETPVMACPVEAPKAEVAVEESEAKKSFRAYMESYKKSNPAKYAIKEQSFIKHLNSL